MARAMPVISIKRPSSTKIRAAADGIGVCLDSMLLAEQELRSGQLVIVLPETAMTARGHAFLTLRSKGDVPRIADFRTWLFGELGRTKEWWEVFLTTAAGNISSS